MVMCVPVYKRGNQNPQLFRYTIMGLILVLLLFIAYLASAQGPIELSAPDFLAWLKSLAWDGTKVFVPAVLLLVIPTVFIFGFLPDQQTEDGYKALLFIIIAEIILALTVALEYAALSARH